MNEESVVRNFRTTDSYGKEYLVSHYNLDMIIAQGTSCNGTTCIRIFGFCGASSSISHEVAMGHATSEYRKYKQRTISDVERDYLFSIKSIEDSVKKNVLSSDRIIYA